MSDIEISYTTVVEKPRTGPVGNFMRWLGDHPLLAGLIGGVGAVLIAMASAFEGVAHAPFEALVISTLVVLVWMVLFLFLSSFFSRQAIAQVEVRRDIEASAERFCWLQDGEPLVSIDAPTYELRSTEVPDYMGEERNADQPWPVWLIVSGGGDAGFVMETKITAGEAGGYERVSDEVQARTDEVLPTTLASPLISLADRKTD